MDKAIASGTLTWHRLRQKKTNITHHFSDKVQVFCKSTESTRNIYKVRALSSFDHKESFLRVLAKIKCGVVQISTSKSYMPLKLGLYQNTRERKKTEKNLQISLVFYFSYDNFKNYPLSKSAEVWSTHCKWGWKNFFLKTIKIITFMWEDPQKPNMK